MQDNEAPIWSVVDPSWYRSFYPVVDSLLSAQDQDTAEDLYDRIGQRLGHSPNPYFSELWYLSQNPDVRESVASGEMPSGFHHFRRHGFVDRPPHWLFDARHYAKQFEAKHNHPLQVSAEGDVYAHFLRFGQHEGLSGHWLFDAATYEAFSSYQTVQVIRLSGPYTAYVSGLGLVSPEPVTSNLFNAAWYVSRYPEVGEGIEDGFWTSALEHYVTNNTPTLYDPSPLFSEQAYLAAYDDVREAIGLNQIRNGYDHYHLHGRLEHRQFFPGA